MRFENIIFFSLFGIYLGALWYVPFRFGRLLSLKRIWLLYTVSFGSVGLMVFSMSHRHSGGSFAVEIVEYMAMIWMGFFMYVLLFLLCFEIVNVIKKLPKKISALSILIFAGVISVFGLWNADGFGVKHIEIELVGLEKELKIVQLSDLHIGPFRGKGYLERVVNETNKHHPDLVLITGDMIDGNNSLQGNILSPLKNLNAPAFFSTGNHESYADFDKALESIENLSIKVLRNERVDTNGIQLIGMDYMKVYESDFDMHSVNDQILEEELPKVEMSPFIPVVMMSHSPKSVEVASEFNIDLVLSGHTHAGQLFPATIAARWIFKYNRGLYKYKDSTLYVSQGLGTVGPRMRVGTQNELTVITLKKKWPDLKGSYLGQSPPGDSPEVFAPGIICNNEHEGSSGFMLTGMVYVFQKFENRECHTYETIQEAGLWKPPIKVPFWKQLIHNGDFIITPDDRTMLFQVKEKLGDRLVSNIWKVQRSESDWGQPEILPFPINTEWNESFASETADKTLYFFSSRPGGKGKFDLYYSRYENGEFLNPVNLGIPVNTPFHEWDPFISIDENYLIFCSTKPEGFGGDDLYISFRHKNQWEVPVNMGEMVNSPKSENRPYVTSDGKYFFFTSSKRGNRDIYWVDVSFLEQFRNDPDTENPS